MCVIALINQTFIAVGFPFARVTLAEPVNLRPSNVRKSKFENNFTELVTQIDRLDLKSIKAPLNNIAIYRYVFSGKVALQSSN